MNSIDAQFIIFRLQERKEILISVSETVYMNTFTCSSQGEIMIV